VIKARLLTTLVLAVVLAALPAVALGGDAHRASNSTSFPDSTGEDAAAPDITSIVVSNDDAGLVSFQIAVANRPALTPDMYFLVFLDTDKNGSTGSSDYLGADYVIQLVPGAVDLFQWNGTTYARATSQASLVFSYAATGPVIKISAADLNKTKAFNFGVVAASGVVVDAQGNPDTTNEHDDFAPDAGHGFNSYNVLTKLVLTVTAFTTAPKPAKAGRTFSASLAANENDTAGPVQSGTVGCAASIAGKRLVAVTHAVRNGVAVCVWRIPATAKGRIVRGLVTLRVRGTSVTRGFSARVT
jgi:hypothetical protein